MKSEKKADSEGAHSGIPELEKEKRDDKTVRVTQRSSIRNLVSYVMMRVKAGDMITVQGLGLGIGKAITVASIVRDRLGSVHQLNSFLEVDNIKKPDLKLTGIQIVLTTQSDLDSKDHGYQKPKP